MEKYQAVLAAVKAHNGKVVDDHSQGSTLQAAGVALLNNGVKRTPVLLMNAKYFSLNELYLEDGVPHVSTRSVGGAVIPMNHNGNLEAAVNAYNEAGRGNQFCPSELTLVNYL